MAWTAPRTWNTGEIVDAATMNQQIRDNLLEAGPAKITGAWDLLAGQSANTLQRVAPPTDTATTYGSQGFSALVHKTMGTGVTLGWARNTSHIQLDSSGNMIVVGIPTTGLADGSVTYVKLGANIPQQTNSRYFVFRRNGTGVGDVMAISELTPTVASGITVNQGYVGDGGQTIPDRDASLLGYALALAVEGAPLTEIRTADASNRIGDFDRYPRKVWINNALCWVYIAKTTADVVDGAEYENFRGVQANAFEVQIAADQIADDAVTTAKINDDAVTTAKINDDAVTTAKVADGAITKAKIAPGAATNEAWAANTDAVTNVILPSTNIASVNITPTSTSARILVEQASNHEQAVNPPDLWIYKGTTRLGRGSFVVDHPNSTSQQTYMLKADEAVEVVTAVPDSSNDMRRWSIDGFPRYTRGNVSTIASVNDQTAYNPREDAVLVRPISENWARGLNPADLTAKSSADINLGAPPSNHSYHGVIYDGSADRVYAMVSPHSGQTWQLRAYNPTTGARESSDDVSLPAFGTISEGMMGFYDNDNNVLMLCTQVARAIPNGQGSGFHMIGVKNGARFSSADANILTPGFSVGTTISWMIYLDWLSHVLIRASSGTQLEAASWNIGDRPFRIVSGQLRLRLQSQKIATAVPYGQVDGPSYIRAREIN